MSTSLKGAGDRLMATLTSALTKHVYNRIRQHGITDNVVDFVLAHADVWLHQGAGCESAMISRRCARKLRRRGFNPSYVDRAKNVIIVLSLKDGLVVTALRAHSSHKARRYFKQMYTRKLQGRSVH